MTSPSSINETTISGTRLTESPNPTKEQSSPLKQQIWMKDAHAVSEDIPLIKLAIVSAVEELQERGCNSKNIEEFSHLTPNHVNILNTVASHRDIRGRRCAVCETHPQEEKIINRILLELQRIRNMMLLVNE